MKHASIRLTSRGRHRLRLLGLIGVVVTGLSVTPSPTAMAQGPVAASGQDGDPTDVIAAAQLAEDYDLSYVEATERIGRQESLQELADDLAETRPETWAGSYIDHEAGGVMVVMDTEPSTVTDDLPPDLSLPVEVDDADHSLAELSAVADEIQDARDIEEGQAPILLDIEDNKVDVPVHPVAPADADIRAEIAEANEVQAGIVDAVANEEVVPTAGECREDRPLCHAPLRGGVGIRAGNVPCTAGFNVESKSDGKRFVLTAGHCTAATASTWWTEGADGGPHDIGTRWPGRTYYPGNDAGLIEIEHPEVGRWHPQWWVLVQQWSGGPGSAPATTENERYEITSTATSQPGTYICKTGLATNTRCGEIEAVGQAVGTPGGNVYNLGYLRIFSCQSDSGGPLFKSHRAYGIQSSAYTADYTGTRFDWNTGIGIFDLQCFDHILYTGIGVALGLTNTKLIGT